MANRVELNASELESVSGGSININLAKRTVKNATANMSMNIPANVDEYKVYLWVNKFYASYSGNEATRDAACYSDLADMFENGTFPEDF